MGTTADVEMMVPTAEDPELSKVLSVKNEVGQNIAMHALPTSRKFPLSRVTFLVHSTLFLQIIFALFSSRKCG